MAQEFISAITDSLKDLQEAFDELQDEKDALEKKVSELEEELEDEKDSLGSIKSIDSIEWKANNLQDINMMEALDAAVSKHGSLKIMKILESVV